MKMSGAFFVVETLAERNSGYNRFYVCQIRSVFVASNITIRFAHEGIYKNNQNFID